MNLADEDRLYAVYDGIVIDNRDPMVIGRVRVMIPGVIEPYSDWAMPIGYPGAGSEARGFWCIPTIGSNVSVMFKMGHQDYPRYLPGPWGAPGGLPDSPTFVKDLSPSDAVQVTGLQTAKWEMILDDRPGQEQLVIRDRVNPDNTVRIDGAAQMVEVSGTVAIQLRSTGVITIDALQVIINGRPILPTGQPI